MDAVSASVSVPVLERVRVASSEIDNEVVEELVGRAVPKNTDLEIVSVRSSELDKVTLQVVDVESLRESDSVIVASRDMVNDPSCVKDAVVLGESVFVNVTVARDLVRDRGEPL